MLYPKIRMVSEVKQRYLSLMRNYTINKFDTVTPNFMALAEVPVCETSLLNKKK